MATLPTRARHIDGGSVHICRHAAMLMAKCRAMARPLPIVLRDYSMAIVLTKTVAFGPLPRMMITVQRGQNRPW